MYAATTPMELLEALSEPTGKKPDVLFGSVMAEPEKMRPCGSSALGDMAIGWFVQW